MTLGWYCPTLVLYGTEGLAQWCRGSAARKATVFVDAAVAESSVLARVREHIGRTGPVTDCVVADGPGDLATAAKLAQRLEDSDLLVAVGGGSVIDQAKLAVCLLEDHETYARLAVPQRSGMVTLPGRARRGSRLVAVPTTVGTGTELSAVACMDTDRGKRLIISEMLRPDVAVIDAEATATLPVELLAEGVLEALFRVVSPYIGDHQDLPTEDALAETIAERLVLLGHEVRDARRTGHHPVARLRGEIAKLSGLSHAGWLVLGRHPYAVKGWLIANELSWALKVRKMTAVAALLPHLWRNILRGDTRWGSRRRLDRMWARLRETAPDVLPGDPEQGIAALLDFWGIDRRIAADADRLEIVAGRTARSWGAGLPMLGELTAADVRMLLEQAAGASAR